MAYRLIFPRVYDFVLLWYIIYSTCLYIVMLRANTPIRPHPFYAVHLGISNVRLYIQLGRSTRVFREYKFPTPVKLLHSLKIFNKGLILPTPLNFKIFNKGLILPPPLNFYIH